MNNLDKQYLGLLQDIIDNGVTKSDRTGTGTISVFGRQIRHKMSDGFPILTTKKVAFKTMVVELLWFMTGNTNIKYLVENGCHIWDGDAYKNYLNVVMYEKPDYLHEKHGHLKMSVKKEDDNYLPLTQEEFINRIKTDDKFRHWGELGPVYGKQWRSWNTKQFESLNDGNFGYRYNDVPIDQIKTLINDLKTNPDSRRLMVSAWNVGELDQMVLPPCHYGFQIYTRELSDEERLNWYKERNLKYSNTGPLPKRAISLMWNQRSVDTFLGLPFNIASYGLLLEIIAKEVNMVPDELIGNLGDTHLYLNHIEQAKEQIGRELTLGERRQMVTQEMFDRIYTGGSPDTLSHSEIDQFNVPKNTREPFKLPELKIGKLVKWKECSCLPNYSVSDFTIENYQSHPSIKAPLSN
jgi:thymidylate synthase